MPEDTSLQAPRDFNSGTPAATLERWGGLACFLLVAGSMLASYIYLVGNFRSAFGPLGYDLADFLSGPVWAASLVTAVIALREQMGEHAPRRMSLALLAAVLPAGAMILVACIRSANRHYHLDRPELHLENSVTVLLALISPPTPSGPD